MTDEQIRSIIAEALEFYLENGGYFSEYDKRTQAREALKRINENE